jgi:sporulation protein YabP
MEKSKSNSVSRGPSNVVMLSRRQMTVSGVSQVTGYDETQIEAETTVGLLLIRGQELNIKNFDAETGDLSLTGSIDGMVYGKREKKRGFFARILK